MFAIEDSAADGWTSEVAVRAASRQEAQWLVRAAGRHRRQIQNGRPVRRLDADSDEFASLGDDGFLRRRGRDVGWTRWETVPVGAPLNWRDDPTAPRTGRRLG